jgi:hypothetical protein
MSNGIFVMSAGLLLGHHLNVHLPAGEVALFDGVEQVPAGALPVARAEGGRLFVGEVFDALLGAEVELHPHPLVVRVEHGEGVLAIEMHVAEAVLGCPGRT